MNLLENSNLTIAVERDQKKIDEVMEVGLLDNYELFCGINLETDKSNYTVDNIEELIQNANVVFLDVREIWEEPRVENLKALEISLDELEESISSIPRDKKVIVFCQTGGRSQQIVDYLEKQFNYTNLYNLDGGIMNYIQK
jgi:adenylyltransferase/sulfurtransferase